MAVTTTIDMTSGLGDRGWKLIRSATGSETLSLSAKFLNKEVVNHNSASTPPAATVEGGHDVLVGRAPLVLSLKSGDHIWGRTAPTAAEDQFDGFVSTVQS